MDQSTNITPISRTQLPDYIFAQLAGVVPFPEMSTSERALVDSHLDEALKRTLRCINEVVLWTPGKFDVTHSTQYCIFIYYLSNTIWRREGNREICTRLFLLNKTLNAVDIFYEIEMPEIFFIGHSAGIVLAKASYSNFLVLYQNSTVGKNHGQAPVIEEGAILYPNTAVIGDSLVRRGSVISQGVGVINSSTEANKIAFSGAGGNLIFKTSKHCIQRDFFRNFCP